MMCFVFRCILVVVVVCAIVFCQKIVHGTTSFRMVMMQVMADQKRQFAKFHDGLGWEQQTQTKE